MINKLREKIDIEKPIRIKNGSGGFTTEYEQHAGPLWAEVSPINGRERFHAKKLEMDVSHRVTIRFERTLNIKPNMRILFNDKIFKILFIINRDERDRWLDLFSEEGSGN